MFTTTINSHKLTPQQLLPEEKKDVIKSGVQRLRAHRFDDN